ncbi:MAG: hypothetical protein HYX89_08405, partial [Chloroflexi bacterium]|nr:hypothetical protein [Chloroflexota bacterium]
MTVVAERWMARVHQPWGLTAWEAAGFMALMAAAATYLLGSVVPIALLGWAIYLVLAATKPALALPLVVMAIPFSWVEKRIPELPFSPTEFILFNTLVAGAIGLAFRGEVQAFLRQRLRGSFELPSVLFLIAGFLASFVAEVREPAVREFRLVVAEPVLFFFIVTRAVKSLRQLWWLVDALAATALVTALIALV